MNEEEYQGFMEKASLATMTDNSGKKTNLTASDLTKMGLVNKIPAQGAVPYYKTDAGITLTAPADRMSITLDESTGNIKIRAPKSITELPEFKQTFNEDTFKAYSLAYKLNPDYKVAVEEKNKDTGEVEEKSVTIPEWVQNRDSALKVFVANVNAAEEKRKILMRKYGEKAKNMTLTNIAMSEQSGKYTYLPEILKGVSVFGDDPNKKNPFKQILDKLGEDGEISEEDLKEVYTRGNFGRTELAGVLATIDGYLKGSDWSSDEYYTDADTGKKVYNTNSAKEAAKLLAFRDFLISHHPEGNWFEEMGGNIETLSLNVLYGADRVFMNIANLGEAAFTWGQSTAVQNYIKGMDQTIGQYNQDKALESEATQVLATLGYIGGTLLGSRLVGALGGAIASDISQHVQSALAGAPSLGPSAMAALTEESIAGIYAASENYVRGAWIAMKYASTQQKVAIAKGIYEGFMNKHGVLDFATSVLIDTFHDALLYDSTSLRDVIANSDGNTAGFWLSQFTDNTKWWTGMALGKGVIKVTGKTAWGKAANVRATRLVNRIASRIGNAKSSLKDRMYGGDVVKRLEEKIEEAVKKNELKKANRLKNQKMQEEWNMQLRQARADLGKLSLEWDGLKLTADSEEAYKNAVVRIKALEIGIDRYNRNIEYQRQLMVGAQYDPSTGKTTFINPSLGEANLRATEWYVKLTDLNKKYNLPLADERSLLNQDVINYWMGRYEQNLATEVAKGTTEKAKKAKESLETLKANIAALSDKLPKEITDFIDEGIDGKIYQNWYAAQNEYGMAKGILNRAKATSYEENPIYKEVGYQPIVLEREASRGRYVDKEGKLNAKIDREFDEIEFKVEPGQNYVDPELVRQSRLSEMAQIEVNNQMVKAYSGFGSDATNVTKVSGEETEYVRQVDSGKKYLETEVAQVSVEKLKELKIPITKVRRRKPIKNIVVPEKDMATIVASMSQDEVAEYLVRHKLMNTGETISGNVSEANYAEWYEAQNSSVKKFLVQQYNEYGVGIKKAGNAENFQLFKRAYEEGGADFEANLQRATLRGDEGFSKSSLANEAKHNISMGKEAFYQGVLVAEVKSRLRNIKNIDTTPLVDNVVESFTGYIDDFVDAVLDDGGAKAAINALSETTDASYDFGRYIALRRLYTSDNMKAAHKQIDDLVDNARKDIKGLDAKDVDVLKHQMHELFDGIVETELDSVSQVVRTTNPDIVNTKSIYDKADELNKKIMAYDDEIKAKGDTNMVMYLDDEGRQVFAEVDPAFASLFNYRYQIDKTEASRLAKINAATSKVFRYGTTSVNLASFGNQLFRDFGNALVVGGSWHTIKFYRNQLVDVFGKNIVEQIERFDPSGYEMKQLEQVAKANGQTLQEAAVSRELMRGAAISPTTTETTLYKKIIKSAYGGDTETTLRDMRNKFQKFVDEHSIDDLLNGKRENYLRNRVYASSLAEAMNSGYTLEQSRVWAEFAMNNATTNFSRQLYHLQAIADSTPYFRAAINGTKSFWRMWSLDPVGISGRITGGLIIPVMYLTGASLGTEENRKVYENIPEYQKAESFVFVINGQIISAPMPQELATIVAPFRQFVEYLHGSNKNDFWELMMNDALGFFPYDLQGFSTIDMDKMIEDPTIFDRMDRGVSRVFSQLAPIPVKTAYMLATGTDPYSGKSLRNPQYSWWNEETNSVETQDYNQNSFAKVVASIPFIKDWVTPELAEKVVSGVIGTTGSHLLGDITALVNEGGEKAFTEAMTNIGSQLTKPFTIAKYDLTDAIWRRAVKELTAEKEVILNSDDMQTINSKLSQEKDPEKRKALLAKRQTLVDSYQQKVGDTVKRLESEYNGTFDYSKFSAVIQLLNFNTNAPYQNASQYSSDLATSLYYEGRDAAIHTMQALGIDGTHDTSVFGYLTKDKDDKTVMKYSNPVAILDMTNTWNNQKDYHLANIKALASQNNLWDKKDAVDNQIDAIYAKGKLSNSDYDAIDAIYVNWNAEVMSALAPYVQDMTPEAAINNQQVLNYLSGLIEVPGDYKKDRYGKYVTNSKLGDGSATQAYIRNYIKNIFKVNDTAYSSGKNYSTRMEYDEKEKRWK